MQTVSFVSPIHDSVFRYTIEVNAANGSIRNVSGSLYVIDPAKVYSITDGNWSNPASWSTNAVPTSTSNVTISHIVTVDTDAT